MPKEYPRKLRLNVQLQRELTALIREELTDPRVAGVTVTTVDVAPDMRQAGVTVSLLGSDEQLKQAVKGLNHAAGKLRHELGERLRLRYVPQLHFSADVALREGDRIAQIIRKAVAEDQLHPAQDHESPEGKV
ncbi:MAG: 30S ribosome-binding factor RbfA [Nevskiaceae bacterium]|nr:MAG: 30S ribosome-binding factor RbfA [Nevskiaceae bacterium]